MTLFDPKENALKILCWYLYWKCVKNGGSKRGVFGGYWGLLTGDMEDRVIIDIIDDLVWPQQKYPENFMSISFLEVHQERGSRRGVLVGRWRLLTGDMEDRVILDVMNELSRPQESYPKNFMLISLLKVCQEIGSRRGVLGGHWRFLTGDMEESVILDIMDDLVWP